VGDWEALLPEDVALGGPAEAVPLPGDPQRDERPQHRLSTLITKIL
jgi:hypothetical protein